MINLLKNASNEKKENNSNDNDVKLFRERIINSKLEDLTLGDIQKLFQDYKSLISPFHKSFNITT